MVIGADVAVGLVADVVSGVTAFARRAKRVSGTAVAWREIHVSPKAVVVAVAGPALLRPQLLLWAVLQPPAAPRACALAKVAVKDA